MRSTQRRRLENWLVGCLVFLAASMAEAESGIYPWLEAGDHIRGALTMDGEVVCELDYKAANDRAAVRPACSFAIPQGSKVAEFKGTIETDGKTAKFKEKWHLVDVAPVTEILYRNDLALVERLRRLTKSLEGWEQNHEVYVAEDYVLKPYDSDGEAAFAAAEKRLGLRLPPALKLLAAYRLVVGDSSSSSPEHWRTVMDELGRDWDYDPEDLQYLAPATRERFARSIMVFTYVGDGLGGLAWDPEGVRDGEPSNIAGADPAIGAISGAEGQGAWFWIHQDTLGDPALLLGPDRRPKDGDGAMLSILQRFHLDSVLEELIYDGALGPVKEPLLTVDSAHPAGRFQLHFGDVKRGKAEANLWFRSYDYEHSMH